MWRCGIAYGQYKKIERFIGFDIEN